MDRLWLPRLISEGMVLQRGVKTCIRGRSKDFDTITAVFCSETYQTQADEAGEFSLKLNRLVPGGPHPLEIRSEAYGSLRIEEVYIGDVYIASGQSNMELPVERVKWFYNEDWSGYENPFLRHFKVDNHPAFAGPLVDHENGEWLGFTEESIQNVSAISIFLLGQLYEKMKIPMGVIQVAIGGTPIQAWLPEGLILSEDLPLLEAYKEDTLRQKRMEEDLQMEQNWQEKLNRLDMGWRESWYKGTDTEKWEQMSIPCDFAPVTGFDFAGAIWLVKTFRLEQNSISKEWLLELGTIVDADEAYINGVLIGQTDYRYPPRRYPVPANILRQGMNEVCLRVKCFNGLGRMTEGKTYALNSKSEIINLRGPWRYKIGGHMPHKGNQEFMHYKPTVLHNGMLAPCFSHDVAGVLWYQGESNTDDPTGYQAYLEKFIVYLRHRFRDKALPVAVIQLANFSVDLDNDSGWPEIREAQRKAALNEDAGLIVTIDVGEYNDLHPLNKKEVAKRISAYLIEGYQSPRLDGVGLSADGREWICRFRTMSEGLAAKGQEAKGFQGIDKNGRILDLHAIVDQDVIRVKRPLDGIEIVELRYAYENDPSKDAIYDERHFPVSPFRFGCSGLHKLHV